MAAVHVGASPVALALLPGDGTLIVANSNRFNTPGTTANLMVVNVDAALHGRPAVEGSIPTGQFPRALAVEPDAPVLLVTNYAADQLEAVNTSNLP
jgi:DNA-binding beta-propeller fold protein YncE